MVEMLLLFGFAGLLALTDVIVCSVLALRHKPKTLKKFIRLWKAYEDGKL